MNQLTFDDMPPAAAQTLSENHRAGQLFHFISKHYPQSERKASNQDRIIADYVAEYAGHPIDAATVKLIRRYDRALRELKAVFPDFIDDDERKKAQLEAEHRNSYASKRDMTAAVYTVSN